MPASGSRRAGCWRGLPQLRAIFSLGAGVDHVVDDAGLPAVPLVRIVDPDLTMRMSEYVALHVLIHHRRQRRYDTQQRKRLWHEHAQPPASDVAIGIMGMGVLGRDAAALLRRLGFQVAGFSRSRKQLPGIEMFSGNDELDAFLRRTEILVCLLPATPATAGILNLELFRKLKRDGAAGGAFLINAGRGALQVDADIVAALDEGTLAARHSRCLPDRAAAGGERAVDASASDHHPAQRCRIRPSAHWSAISCGRSSGSRPACRSIMSSTARWVISRA